MVVVRQNAATVLDIRIFDALQRCKPCQTFGPNPYTPDRGEQHDGHDDNEAAIRLLARAHVGRTPALSRRTACFYSGIRGGQRLFGLTTLVGGVEGRDEWSNSNSHLH